MSDNKYIASSSQMNEGKTIPDKITALRNMSISYEMRLRGGVFDTNTNSWIIKNRALAGENFINNTTGIITSFCENVNLFTTKNREQFILEYSDAFFKVNNMALNDLTINEQNYKPVIKMFKDTLGNIGDVILGSKDSLKGVFDKYETPREEVEEF